MTEPRILQVPPEDAQSYDCLALGEVMLRLDPGEGRIRRANAFNVWEGGGEYNVVQGLSQCFNRRTAIVSALVDNEVGRLIEGLIRRSGVDSRWIHWQPHDGLGQAARNGLYFMERGFGERGAAAVMDRGHTAIAQLQASDIDWSALFSTARPRWFHVGGVMAGLSELSHAVVAAAMQAARAQGAVVSYDLNYRASLWQSRGGRAAAKAANAELIQYADVLFGVESLPRPVDSLDEAVFGDALQQMQQQFPHLRQVVSTMRVVKDASHNDWSGICLSGGQLYSARPRLGLSILDRVGGGDAFAGGYIHAMLAGMEIPQALDIATAHGALVMTTPGDNSMLAKADVLACAQGDDAAARR
uniref:sugar kinase n=1 Tax=Marinobacterium profundum TaxID=1714300 RepID=UPI0008326C62|nr:sugar kinase [Marinobacterium profundum]